MNRDYRRILIAFQFLTIIPLKVKGDISETEIRESSAFFPLVGAFQGAVLVTANFILVKVFPTELTNSFLVLLLLLTNGGFHLDALADTFDALGVKSEGNLELDRRRRLSIMKDSTIGPIGVTAVVFTLLLKFLALNNLSHISVFIFYFSLFMMPILPKWTMVVSMAQGKPAREDGLGRIFINRIGPKELAISTLLLLFILVLLKVIFTRYTLNILYIFYGALLIMLYLFSLTYVSFFNRKFGGLTGDTVGAMSEITEVVFLLLVIVWSRLST